MLENSILVYGFWFVVFFFTAAMVWNLQTVFVKSLTIVLLACVFLLVAIKERNQIFDPVAGIPDSSIEFIYRHHTMKATEDGYFVYLWITRVDNKQEVMYAFPYIGNETTKNEFDKLKNLIDQRKASIGSYRMLDPKKDKLGETYRREPHELVYIIRNIRKYENLKGENQ